MFLTENSVANAPDCFGMMSFLNEADSAYSDLCLKMCKLEHNAIVSENASLLNEGVAEFKDRTALLIKRIQAKFFAFLDRIKAEWSKLVAKIQTLSVNFKALKKAMNNRKAADRYLKDHPVELPKSFTSVVTDLSSKFEKATKCDSEDLINAMKDLNKEVEKDFAKRDNVVVNSTIAGLCMNFLSDRPSLIKDLEVAKRSFLKVAKIELKYADKNEMDATERAEGKLLCSKFSSYISKMIVLVNKHTGFAVKVTKVWMASQKTANTDEKYKGGDTTSVFDLF